MEWLPNVLGIIVMLVAVFLPVIYGAQLAEKGNLVMLKKVWMACGNTTEFAYDYFIRFPFITDDRDSGWLCRNETNAWERVFCNSTKCWLVG